MTGRLLLGVCGSANILTLPQHLIALAEGDGPQIRVVMTRSAAALLPPTTLGLLCPDVLCDGRDELTTHHVSLAAWADRLVVLPATANILGQAAGGLASGLLSTVLLAHERPVLFFPAMNRRMWQHPAVRRNVARLRADGHVVMEPVLGRTWQVATQDLHDNCGLPSPATVRAVVDEFLRLPLDGDQPTGATAPDTTVPDTTVPARHQEP
ncbi:flavoprotein [Streptacidiphilus jiangxiensis]|uniref:Flavoprotein n=1 Tax=Streptacidiphilus jiangxiensis TaxID=235985 RepID=A0A1H7MVL1_STRJI|nr:flavoprotein [Streptacidiphilus jiangxiensis]SEL15079.1 Flavoprotein [Streptacidiphilus jiangxiensis]